jgi:hypothetical protein
MAGENSLLPQYYHDDFQVLSYTFTGAIINDPTAILYADRNLILDEIVVGIHTASTAAGSGAISFDVSTNPIDTGGTVVCTISTDDDNVDAGNTVVSTTDSVIRYSSAGAALSTATGSTAIDKTTNFIPKGSWLVLDTTGTFTGGRCTIQIRFRSRPK